MRTITKLVKEGEPPVEVRDIGEGAYALYIGSKRAFVVEGQPMMKCLLGILVSLKRELKYEDAVRYSPDYVDTI